MNDAYIIAMYLRLSLHDGSGESESIAGQRDLIRDYISVRHEFDDGEVMEFVDDGWSGTDFNRPAVKKMLDMARRGDISCIIVKDFSRFGRNYIEVGDYMEQIFPFLGVRFISVNNNFDSQSRRYACGSLDISFKNLVNELYSKDISKKVKTAKYTKMKNGEFMSSCPPYGYVISTERRNRLIVDPIAAINIRRIFDLYVSGNSTATIASVFNAEKIPTRSRHLKSMGCKGLPRNASFWTQETIGIMLRDETYIGTFIARQTKVAKVGSSKRIPLPPKDQIILHDNHDAIVTKEVFGLAQKRMGAKNKTQRVKHTHLFSGKVICGHCRLALRRRESKTNGAYFICNSYRFAKCGCASGRLSESELHDTLLYVIKKQAGLILKKDSFFADIRVKDTAALRASVDNLKQSKIQLYEQYKADELSKDIYLAKRGQIEHEISSINARIDDIQNRPAQQSIGAVHCLSEAMVKALVSYIYVYSHDSIEISWSFNDGLVLS
ncbi:MAG: recombinase family protein [Defluviitaleaceae bacterium]|nr:recombinase family protein [Defluviitaleaceae bacterium]